MNTVLKLSLALLMGAANISLSHAADPKPDSVVKTKNIEARVFLDDRIKADAPLSEMFGYIGSLRTMTSGRGQFSMEFSHYAPCPTNVADQVIQEVKERKAAS